jgi:isopentenyl-diphosphate delta-isomerase
MPEDIAKRKVEHLKIAMDSKSQHGYEPFSEIKLPYRALPELDLAKVNTSVSLLGKKLNQPLIIASMTGGSEHGEKINGNLAAAAEKMKVALGVGSQRVMLVKEEAKKSFAVVRKMAPTAVVLANMGAIQLNYGYGVDEYRKIVEMIEADALYLHVNPIQEAIQPEGDTNWEGLIKKIGTLVKKMPVPVWVKEVGCGLDAASIKRLIEVGVTGIDVAGVGGTSWPWIEAQRAENENLAQWFGDFGIDTQTALVQANKVCKKKKGMTLVASGGLRSPVQGLKARLLGADLYSAARPFLEAAMESSEAVEKVLGDWEKGLAIAMFGCGMKKW